MMFYPPINLDAASPWLEDPEGDVILSIGKKYPGIIDLVYAEVNVFEEALNITIEVRDAISTLNPVGKIPIPLTSIFDPIISIPFWSTTLSFT